MFKINHRIVDEIDELKLMSFSFFDIDYEHITGFIEISFGEQKEGCYYHENPLQEGEIGGELLDYWFNKLLDVTNSLPITKYAAFKELETVNCWMEFKLIDNNVVINKAIDVNEMNNNSFIAEFFSGFDYAKPLDFSVGFMEFKNEVISKISRFITELKDLNPELLKTKMALELSRKLSLIQHT